MPQDKTNQAKTIINFVEILSFLRVPLYIATSAQFPMITDGRD